MLKPNTNPAHFVKALRLDNVEDIAQALNTLYAPLNTNPAEYSWWGAAADSCEGWISIGGEDYCDEAIRWDGDSIYLEDSAGERIAEGYQEVAKHLASGQPDWRIDDTDDALPVESIIINLKLLLGPGQLRTSGDVLVEDGDTLICSCSRDKAAAGKCHRAWAGEYLAREGWRVILDGKELGS